MKRVTFIFILLLSSGTSYAQYNQTWVNRFNGSGNANDYPSVNSIVTDECGYTHVTGTSRNSNGDNEIVTLKYGRDGGLQWSAVYNAPGLELVSGGIAEDSAGNLFVCGWGDDTDFLLVKYNKYGQQQWVRFYDAFGYPSQALKVTADTAGNAYVLGYVTRSDQFTDYAILKYSPTGTLLWASLYDGPAGRNDYPSDIAVDHSGNVYATGRSEGNGTDFDFATVKYDAGGNLRWVARHNGSRNSYDESNAMVIDRNGNVYVTGGTGVPGGPDSVTTIKYNDLGQVKWVSSFNHPAMPRGRGYSIGLFPQEAFAPACPNEGDGLANGEDALANNAFVYVMAQVLSVGVSASDIVVLKYNLCGGLVWNAKHDTPGFDEARSMKVDAVGNVYVAGWATAPGNFFDYVTFKCSAAGQIVWNATYDGPGPGGGADKAFGVAIDKSGKNIYVTGFSDGSNGASDYATIRYSVPNQPVVNCPDEDDGSEQKPSHGL